MFGFFKNADKERAERLDEKLTKLRDQLVTERSINKTQKTIIQELKKEKDDLEKKLDTKGRMIEKLKLMTMKLRDQNEADILYSTLKLIGMVDSEETRTKLVKEIDELKASRELAVRSIQTLEARNLGLGELSRLAQAQHRAERGYKPTIGAIFGNQLY